MNFPYWIYFSLANTVQANNNLLNAARSDEKEEGEKEPETKLEKVLWIILYISLGVQLAASIGLLICTIIDMI